MGWRAVLIRVVTIAHEYGSGGAELGQRVARKMGWELLDGRLVDRVAHAAGVDQKVAAALDEQIPRWWQWAITGYAASVEYGLEKGEVIHEDFLHEVTMAVMQRAADSGNCVIVGRGAQCFLQDRSDIFNVLAYAPIQTRIRRLRLRHPDCKYVETLIRDVDTRRAKYVRHYFRKDWLDTSLYDLCINTLLGIDFAPQLIAAAIGQTGQQQNETANANLTESDIIRMNGLGVK
jgi:cytidylate kinase